ncbi:unnamed protein product [Calypogeia fissa]
MGDQPVSGVVSTVGRASDDTPLLLPGGNSHGGHFGSYHDGLSSVKKTFCNIVISVGVLGMPYTFKQSGWLSRSLALAFIGLASYYNMMLLVKSKRKLESEGNDNIQSYSDLGFVAHGELGRMLVDVAIIISQGGFCVAYLIFTGENLASVVSSNGDQLQPNFVNSDQGETSLQSGKFSFEQFESRYLQLHSTPLSTQTSAAALGVVVFWSLEKKYSVVTLVKQ